MAHVIKRRLLSIGSPSAVVASFLGRLLTTRGDMIRRGSSAVERLALGATGAPIGSDGTDLDYLTQAEIQAFIGYEVGSFTPTLAFATPGTSSFTYATQSGIYIKFGRMVWVSIRVDVTPTIGTGSGNCQWGGLPFAPDNSNIILSVGSTDADWTWPAGRTSLFALTQSGQTFLLMQSAGSAVSSSTFAASNMTSGNAHDVRISGVYRAAS